MSSTPPGTGASSATLSSPRGWPTAPILIVHAQDPIQVVTERVWRRGEKEDIPHVIVVNHLDRERTDFGAVVEQLGTGSGSRWCR